MSAKPLSKKLFLCAVLCLATIFSRAQLVPQFNATPLTGCAPLVVNFTDQTTGGATQWQWDLGNSTISFLQNPSVTYFNPGTYTVKLVVQNAAGTKDSIIKTQYITVYALPTVDFSATPLTGCYPLPVQFSDNSVPGSGTITGWLWDFGDGNSSAAQNPSHIYTASGNYNVSLRITNSNGCSKTLTRTNYINITTGVQAVFTNSIPAGCTAPETITFQNQSTGTGALTYAWTFGDGGTSSLPTPSHTYIASGSYTVQLIVTNANGCRDTATHLNAINIGTVHADFTLPAIACAGTAFTLNNTSAPLPLSVLWTFGDATSSTVISPVKAYAAPGTYPVKLVSNFGGCLDSITKNITVLPKPSSAFTGSPLNSCSVPHTVNFANSSAGAVSSQWFFGDGGTSSANNPSHIYTTPGTYNVMLVSTNASGCTDTLTRTAYVNIQLPVATINNLPQQGCAPLAWTFNATVNSSDPVVGYQWDFGDGNTSTSISPTHTFAAGIYDIQLIITTASGCTDTVKVLQGIKATVKPVAAFSANPRDVCAKIPVAFQDLSTGTITNWLWFFGDGTSSTVQNPLHAYQDTGYFDVMLIVGNDGCFDTLVLNQYIHIKPPIAIFSVDLDCNNHFTKTFTDQSIGADQWNWDFGDGNTSTLQNPVHTYAATGTYTVSLTVVNLSTGCDYTKTMIIVIADEHAAFTATVTEICKNTAADFTATSLHTPAAIINYDWDFGDGGTGTGATISHVYVQAGLYTVRLIITDVNGCMDTLVRNQYIKVNGPTAGFISTVPGSCLLTAVNFTDLSLPDGTHPISQWHWYYGDGNNEVLTAAPFQHTYSAAGIYTVALVVQDSYGCTDSISMNSLLTISTPVAAFASVDTVSCPGKDIVFSNASTGPSLTYHWDFGDGNTSNSAAPTHTYAADGLYTVQLSITDQYGCTDISTKPQYIKIASPVALFAASDTFGTCPPLIVQFTNNSQNQASWSWDFGDGNTSTAQSPSHFYNVAGVYFAKLTVTSPGGCTAVKTQRIEVKGPSGTFIYAALTGCSPLNVNFTATTQSAASFIWDFNDGNTLVTTDSVLSHIYTIPGVYVPKMILKDIAGCTVAITGPDTIKVNGVQALFTPDTLIRCNNGNVSFANNSQSNDVITGYLWDFGDGTTSTDFEPVHFYAAQGMYYPSLTVTTQTGCTNSVTASVPVRVVKTPEITFTQLHDGCAPLSMDFHGQLINPDTSAITWHWTFSNGLQSNTQNPAALLFSTAGIYSAQVIAINSSGCRDTANSVLEAFGIPIVNAGSDQEICQGSGKVLTANGADSYFWSPATGLSCANCPSPIATPDSLTTYTVTGASIHGCTATDQVKVAVNYPFNMQNSPGDTLCKGQSAILSASGAVSYSWSPSLGLNTTSGNTVNASPATTTHYRVIGYDGKNCFTDTAYFMVKVYPIPTVAAGADRTINVGQTITLTPAISTDVTNVVWSPTNGIVSNSYPSVTVRPTMDMEYKATVTNAGGCTASDIMSIHVLCNGANVFIPNTFSPNGDGANEIFYARGTGLFTIKQARIFNRWGEEVYAKYSFNANDANAGWDGTYKGQKLTPDVYVYMFEIQCENNTTLIYKGNIALIR
jgi:gliding motility-associated-like protein